MLAPMDRRDPKVLTREQRWQVNLLLVVSARAGTYLSRMAQDTFSAPR
jgi:hypothetical protein